MTYIVAVDAGKHSTKAICEFNGMTKRLSFRTKMDRTNEDVSIHDNTAVIQVEGDKSRYLIGEAAEYINFDRTKTLNIHKYASYYAISLLVPEAADIVLTVGIPLNIFKNRVERQKYLDFIKGDGEIKIKVNGEEKSFTIKEIYAAPEGSGQIFKDPEKFKNRVVGVIDIGGLNVNACVYKNLAPVESTMVTNNLGANVLRNNVRLKLNEAFTEIDLKPYQMDMIVEDGFIRIDKEKSSRVIQAVIKKHVKEIMDELKKALWDLNTLDIVFTGGGSITMKEELEKAVPGAIFSTDAVFDNSNGFLVVARLQSMQK